MACILLTMPKKSTEDEAPQATPKTAKQEADALLAELEHPTKPDQTDEDEDDNSGAALGIVWATVRTIFNWLITPFAIVIVLHFFVFQAYQVVGSSMFSTLQDSNYLIISKVGASFTKLRGGSAKHVYYIPHREQVVVFIAPPSPTQTFVKRVAGLPGDRVVVKDGRVTIYNSQHPEGFDPDANNPVERDAVTQGDIDEVVPPGNVFVMGDNRTPGGSYDSREWGFLPSENIIGVAILRLLPVNEIRLLNLPLPAALNRLGQNLKF